DHLPGNLMNGSTSRCSIDLDGHSRIHCVNRCYRGVRGKIRSLHSNAFSLLPFGIFPTDDKGPTLLMNLWHKDRTISVYWRIGLWLPVNQILRTRIGKGCVAIIHPPYRMPSAIGIVV